MLREANVRGLQVLGRSAETRIRLQASDPAGGYCNDSNPSCSIWHLEVTHHL